MKDLLFLLCFLSISIQFNKAQNFTHEFGKYSGEEFEMKQYNKDPSAEAVVIYDIGLSHFTQTDEGFQIEFERKIKIKIFTKAGLKWAQFEIPFYVENQQFEKISDIRGNTYNYENGGVRITKLNTKNTYDEKLNEHWMIKKFAMPDIKEGSVIEIAYTITSPYIFNFRNWEFQSKIPVIYSEYKTKMIPFYEYSYIFQGAKKFDRFNSYIDPGISNQFGSINYQDMVYEFVMENVPAFKDEGFITSSNDYIIKLDFQLATIHRSNGTNQKIMTTWPKLIEDVLDEDAFGKYLKASQKNGTTINDTMKLQLRPEKDRAEIIDRYVKSNFNWNGSQDKFASKTLKEFLKTKTGNCSDINLYLAGLLKAVGIEAYPVLISTRDHGKIKFDYPFHHFFNYVVVIAKIDNKYIYMDATEPLARFKEVPTRCLNDKGLIINKSKTEWANFGSIATSTTINSMGLKLNSNTDSISATFLVKATGYDALNLRRSYLKDPKNLKKELINSSISLTDSMKTNNLYQIDKSLEITFKAQTVTEKIEDKLLVSPFCEMAISENPLKQDNRTYPIDMTYKKARHFISTINIPDGYKITNKPENLTISNNNIELQYIVKEIENNIIIVDGYYNFKKDVYDSSDYNFLKGYFNTIVDKFNEKIIFAKN